MDCFKGIPGPRGEAGKPGEIGDPVSLENALLMH